ncbi:MAG: helix-turn-helix domain-containing protein, partial [Dehalococcoidia bacterium]
MTQKQLAEEASFSVHQTVSQIEKGQREVKAWELAALAKALRVDITDLLSDRGLEPAPQVLWRKTPAAGRETIEANFVQHCQQYATLEQLSGEVIERELPLARWSHDDFTYNNAKLLAERTSKEFDLGSRPAASLVGTLENNYGVKIWYEELGEEGSAASTVGSFGPAILMNSTEAPWRRNFNFAHELFHLLTLQIIPVESLLADDSLARKTESLADAFASRLLLPAEPLLNAFQRHVQDNQIQYTDFIGVAREFDV